MCFCSTSGDCSSDVFKDKFLGFEEWAVSMYCKCHLDVQRRLRQPLVLTEQARQHLPEMEGVLGH